MDKQPHPIIVRAGLALIRGLVALKAVFLFVVKSLERVFLPFGKVLLRFIVLPIYGLFFGIKRQLGQFYRPAKNRLMFLLTNRYTVHATIVAIAVAAGVVNIQLTEVRAAADSFGQQSLLYNIVSEEEVEVIEETAESFEPPVSSTIASGVGFLKVSPGAIAPITTTSSIALGAGGLALSTPGSERAVPEPATPRSETITYKVEEGDTLSTIARKFGLSLNTVLWANNFTVRSLIKPGMELAILPVDGVEHTVKSGDTLSGLASKYDVAADEVLAYNNLESADALKIGQELIIPGGELKAPAPTTRTVAVRDIFTTAPTTSGSNASLAKGARMIWPTDLKYIVRKLSWFHTGWDIDCNGHSDGSSTNDNYAATDGIVQFAGSKGGYGIAVEINHGNGLVTRYGHFHSLYVRVGDSVSAGTPLGRCGSTGKSTGTHLHFEVIANGSFQNPGSYLGY